MHVPLFVMRLNEEVIAEAKKMGGHLVEGAARE
jgi:hypothetical protein